MPVVVGPIAAARDMIIDRVAELLHVAPDDVWVAAAVDSAIIYARTYTNRDEVGLPDDPLTVNGVVVFAQRLYLDTPSGVNVAVGDAGFEPIFQPEHLWKHVRHYFDPLDIAYGIA